MMKTKLMSRILCVIIALLTVISLSVTVAGALTSPDYRNSETGFSAYIPLEKNPLSGVIWSNRRFLFCCNANESLKKAVRCSTIQ